MPEIIFKEISKNHVHDVIIDQGVHTNYFQNSSFYSPKSSIFPGFRIEKGTFFQSKW